MEFELKSAQRKFEKEQRERRDQARKKAEKERKVKADALRRQEAMEEAQRIRRLEEMRQAESARLREETAHVVSGGIQFDTNLLPIPIVGDGDKVLLPPSSLAELEFQQALDKGPMFFELSLRPFDEFLPLDREADQNEKCVGQTGRGPVERTTHAGVLEFTAEEGTIGLPTPVIRNLGIEQIGDVDSQNIVKDPTLPGVVPDLKTGVRHTSKDVVYVRYVRLPKATYAKLQPEALDFAEVPNHKAVLETSLRAYSTLTAGNRLTVFHGGLDYVLRVAELKPDRAVTVIETDMEVDVIPPESGSINEGRVLVPLTIGKSQDGKVDEGQFRYFKFAIDDKLAKAVALGEVDVVVTLDCRKVHGDANGRQEHYVAPTSSLATSSSLSSAAAAAASSSSAADESDADLYIAAHQPLYPTQHDHHYSSHDVGKKTVVISSQGARNFLGPGSYSVGIHGFKGTSTFSLLVEARPRSLGDQPGKGQTLGKAVQGVSLDRDHAQGGGVGPFNQEAPAGFAACANCRQLVPERTVSLHEAYCKRHNVPCEFPGCPAVLRREDKESHVHCIKCGQAMTNGELRKHEAVYHAQLTCECGAAYEMEDMVKHKADSCPLRTIVCPFCGDSVRARGEASDPRDRVRGLTQHESECGSRTAPCDQCQRSFMLKDMDLHRRAVHELHPIHEFRPIHKVRPIHESQTPEAVQCGGQEGLGGGLPGVRSTSPGGARPGIGQKEVGGGVPSVGDFHEAPALAGTGGGREGTLGGGIPGAGSPGGNHLGSNFFCPVCNEAFLGLDAHIRLNAHLDGHFSTNGGERMEIDEPGHVQPPPLAAKSSVPDAGRWESRGEEGHGVPDGSLGGTYRSSMKVECPICGTAVHSERDLNTHIDMVH